MPSENGTLMTNAKIVESGVELNKTFVGKAKDKLDLVDSDLGIADMM